MQSLPEPLRRFAPFIGVALALIVGYLAYGKLTGGGSKEPEAAAEAATAAPTAEDLAAAADEKKDRRDDEVAGPIVSLGAPFVVNLGDPGLKTTVQVAVAIQVDEGTPVVAGEDGGAAHLAEEVLARDVVLDALGGLTSANLLAPSARDDVRALLLRRLNRGLPATLALEAYFTELTVENAAAGAEPVDLEAKAEDPAASDSEDTSSEDTLSEDAATDEASTKDSEDAAADEAPAEKTDEAAHEASDPAAEAEAQAKAQVEEEKAQAESGDHGSSETTKAKTTEEHE